MKTILLSLNHLLAQESWASGLLRQYSGKAIRFDLPVTQINFMVDQNGFLEKPKDDVQMPAVILTMGFDVFTAYLSGGKEAASRHVKISGDVDFAQAVAKLATQLKWEYEEDLSKLVGDTMAHAIVQATKKVTSHGRSAISDVGQSFIEFLIHEKPTLVERQALDVFKFHLKDLRDDVDRLEKRIERLSERLS